MKTLCVEASQKDQEARLPLVHTVYVIEDDLFFELHTSLK